MDVSAFWETLAKLGSEFQEVYSQRDALRKKASICTPQGVCLVETPRVISPGMTPPLTARLETWPRIDGVQAIQPQSHTAPDIVDGTASKHERFFPTASDFDAERNLRNRSDLEGQRLYRNRSDFEMERSSFGSRLDAFGSRLDIEGDKLSRNHSVWTTTSTQFTGVNRGASNVRNTQTSRSASNVATRGTSRSVSNIPQQITLFSIWLDTGNTLRVASSPSFQLIENRRRAPGEANAPKIGDALRSTGWWQRLIVRPSSRGRLAWDFTTIGFLAFDVLFIPLMAFQIPETGFSSFMSVAIAFFWSLDMVFTFFVGFHHEGVIEMRPNKIAQRYLKGWLVFDIIIVLTDWLSIFISAAEPSGITRATKSLRIGRAFRAFRLIRVAKILSIIKALDRLFQYESSIIVFGMVKFIIFMMMINHYIACGWYAVGEYHPYRSDYTWVQKFIEDSGRNPNEMTILYKYTTSLHWSFTQFTTASMEVTAENSLERIYSIIVVFFALLIFSSFVSQITALVTAHRNKHSERNRQAEHVRTYLSTKGLSLELGNRVLSFLRIHSRATQTTITESDVVAFKRLPEQLLIDLHAEVYMPGIATHPFFHHFMLIDEESFVHICHVATSELALAKGSNLFSSGQEATKMYFVKEGSLHYLYRERSSEPEIVPEHSYLCDVSLWLQWYFQGLTTSADTCDIFELDSLEFQFAMLNSRALPSCRRYAVLYVEHLAMLQDEDVGGIQSYQSLLDLSLDFDILQEMAQKSFEEQMVDAEVKNNISKFRLQRKLNSSFISISSVGSMVKATWGIFRCCCGSKRKESELAATRLGLPKLGSRLGSRQ